MLCQKTIPHNLKQINETLTTNISNPQILN